MVENRLLESLIRSSSDSYVSHRAKQEADVAFGSIATDAYAAEVVTGPKLV